MDRFVTIRVFGARQRDHMLSGYEWVASRPSWVTRVALVTFLLIVGLPVLLLLGVAILAAVGVFFVLAAGHFLLRKVQGLLPARDGRSNVRVIRRP